MTAARWRWLAGWFVLSVALSTLALWQARASFAQSLSQQLQRQLPEPLNEALQNRFNESELFDLVRSKLNRDLEVLSAAGPLPLLDHCRAYTRQLLDAPGGTDTGGDLTVQWGLGESPQRTDFAIDCAVNWPVLVASQAALALLILFGVILLPRPLPASQRARIRDLIRMGVPVRQAGGLAAQLQGFNAVQSTLFTQFQADFSHPLDQLLAWIDRPAVASLGQPQLPWFWRAREIDRGNLDWCLAVAQSPAQIQFDTATCRVTVHGITVPLAKTPFFYFLWYGHLRLGGDGWLLNPPVNRPDRNAANALIELMESHGGHNKAINDLRENGLRARTLDQNRNKIKDELIAVLGDELVGAYLFESERDAKSGRHRYRLAVDGAAIQLL